MKASTAFVVGSTLLLCLEVISAQDFEDYDVEFLKAFSRIRELKENLIREHHIQHVNNEREVAMIGIRGARGPTGEPGIPGYPGVYKGVKGKKGESAMAEFCRSK